MQASHKRCAFFYVNGFILETCHICTESLMISLHGNVGNSKFIKTIPLESRQATPLALIESGAVVNFINISALSGIFSSVRG